MGFVPLVLVGVLVLGLAALFVALLISKATRGIALIMAGSLLGIFSLLTCSCTDPSDSINEQNQPQGNGKESILFRILILGDSLTEGYGVSDDEAYPTLLEEKLNAELEKAQQLKKNHSKLKH